MKQERPRLATTVHMSTSAPETDHTEPQRTKGQMRNAAADRLLKNQLKSNKRWYNFHKQAQPSASKTGTDEATCGGSSFFSWCLLEVAAAAVEATVEAAVGAAEQHTRTHGSVTCHALGCAALLCSSPSFLLAFSQACPYFSSLLFSARLVSFLLPSTCN